MHYTYKEISLLPKPATKIIFFFKKKMLSTPIYRNPNLSLGNRKLDWQASWTWWGP
jgi:hypothetical protein